MSYANFQAGWVPFSERTAEQMECHERAVAAMGDFRVVGSTKVPDTKKVILTQVWSHPAVVAALGFAFTRFHQLTGSCVGAGGGNCETTLQFIEAVKLGERVRLVLPFWLYTYGKSRQRSGMRGRGSGSTGSGYAEAARLDGYLPSDANGLPSMSNEDGVVVAGESVELQWSDGAAISQAYVDQAKKNLVKSTAQCKSSDDVREAILNGYPCTDACSGFVGHPRVQGSSDEAVLIGSIDSNGGHQTSFQGWMEHPTFGELFLYQNNWPAAAYPTDPAGGTPCSAWVKKSTVNSICGEGEVYAFSQFDGFPAQDLEKVFFRILGA
jgi:hypothetical protein